MVPFFQCRSGNKVLHFISDTSCPGGQARFPTVSVTLINCLAFNTNIHINSFRPELKNYHFEILTNKFCDIFTKESPESYFIPPKTESTNQTIARGKFVDKYRNLRTALKDIGLLDLKNSDDESEMEQNPDASKKDCLLICLKLKLYTRCLSLNPLFAQRWR